MIVTLFFVLLATLSLLGALGLVLCRQRLHCLLSFVLFSAAMAGLYLLLNMRFVALIQLTIGTALSAWVLTMDVTLLHHSSDHRPRIGHLIAVLPFAVLACIAILRGAIESPVLVLPPIWATGKESIPSLGRVLTDSFVIVFGLLGLMLFTSIVAVTYLFQKSEDSL